MGVNTVSSAEIVAHRRRLVASLRLRRLSQREITKALEQQGLRHPTTDEPWSLTTVHLDCRALAEEWQATAVSDIGKLKGEHLAELREVRRAAWSEKDYMLVLRSLKQEAELLGLDAPQKVDIRSEVHLIAVQLGVPESEAVAIAEQVIREARR